MRKLARICNRLKRRYGLQFAVICRNRRYFLYRFDDTISTPEWVLDLWCDSLQEIEEILVHQECCLKEC